MGQQLWFSKACIALQERPSAVTEEAGFTWNIKKSISEPESSL
jgi:hypothetical protein